MIASRFSFIKPVIIKIGSSRTIVVGRGRKIIIDESARIATSLLTGEVMGVGNQAARLRLAGSSDISINPLFWQGIPLDEEQCLQYVYSLRKKLSHTLLSKIVPLPMVAVIPSQLPKPYEKMFMQILREANFLPIATVSQISGEFRYAVGNTVPHHTILIIRMGESLTQVGLYTSGTQVYTTSMFLGGSDFDRLLQIYIRSTYGMTVSLHALPTIKEQYVKATMSQSQFSVVLRGKDTNTGVLRSIQLSQADIRAVSQQFFEDVASKICFALRSYQEVIAAAHPQVSLFLSGGLSLMPEAKTSFATVFGRTPELVSRPHIASALGAATMVEHKEL